MSVNFNNYYNKISNSGHDENGQYNNGAAGDQTGTQWQIVNWYSRPWNVVLRHPSTATANLIAELAIEAANNNKIGYDQSQRWTFWDQLKSSGYRPANITNNCESDCSAGVAAIVKATGYLLSNNSLKNVSSDCYTGNLKNALVNAGFVALTDSKYLTSSAYLKPGDILLYEYHHTAINLGIGSQSGYKTTTSTSETTSTKEIQKLLNTVGWSLEVDNSYGPKTTAAVKEFQKMYNLTVDGKAGEKTVAMLKNVANLVKTSGFNAEIYAANYADLKKKYGTDKKKLLQHFYIYGHKEKRNCKTLIKKEEPKKTTTKKETKKVTSVKKEIPLNTTGKYSQEPKLVGKVTGGRLNVRKGPGTNYSNLPAYPILDNGTLVDLCDAVKGSDGDKWYYIRIASKYFGFVNSNWIKIM